MERDKAVQSFSKSCPGIRRKTGSRRGGGEYSNLCEISFEGRRHYGEAGVVGEFEE